MIIAPQSPIFGISPYTLQYGSCGDPGQYIHLTPEFVTLQITDFGPKGFNALLFYMVSKNWNYIQFNKGIVF